MEANIPGVGPTNLTNWKGYSWGKKYPQEKIFLNQKPMLRSGQCIDCLGLAHECVKVQGQAIGVNRISMCGFQTDAPRGVASSGKQKDVSGSSPYCFLLFKYTYCLAGNRLKDRQRYLLRNSKLRISPLSTDTQVGQLASNSFPSLSNQKFKRKYMIAELNKTSAKSC